MVQPTNAGRYRGFIERMQAYNAAFRVVGFTATPWRGNGVWCHSGPNVLWSDIASTVGMKELIDDGYLSPLTNAPTDTRIDTSDVGTTAGDYNLKQLGEVSDKEEITMAAVSEIIRNANEQDRNHCVTFCVTVAHAHHVSDELRRQGETAVKTITGKTPKADRDKILADFKAGHIRHLQNVGVVAVGFDSPNVDQISLLRPTKSKVLIVQMLGRGTRICDGKTDCQILDFTDSVLQSGPIDLIKGRPYRKPQENADAPHCLCTECGSKNPPSALVCALCGAEIPHDVKPVHARKASDAPVLSTSGGSLHQVGSVSYHRHKKPGSPDSVCVSYWAGNGGLLDHTPIAREWVCIEHPEGYAKNKALLWLKRRNGGNSVPETVDGVLSAGISLYLLEPIAITVAKRSRYAEITGAIFP